MPKYGYPLRGTDGPRAGGISRLADAADLPQATVSRLVNGKAEPSIETLRKLGAVLGFSLGQMLLHAGWATSEELAPTVAIPSTDGVSSAAEQQHREVLAARRDELAGEQLELERQCAWWNTHHPKDDVADLLQDRLHRVRVQLREASEESPPFAGAGQRRQGRSGMTGPEHYCEGERLLSDASFTDTFRNPVTRDGQLMQPGEHAALIGRAMAHFAAAQAAAALCAPIGVASGEASR